MPSNTITSYQDLIVWQKSMVLVKSIYRLTKDLPDEEKFGLVSQMRRCSISIPSNIAEGTRRSSRKDYRSFLRIGYGSIAELETQLILCKELGFLSADALAEPMNLLTEVSKMLNTMIANLSV